MEKPEISEVRKDVNEKLKQEFDRMHDMIINQEASTGEQFPWSIGGLIDCQLKLAAHLIREERAKSGNGAYLLPPYYREGGGIDGEIKNKD